MLRFMTEPELSESITRLLGQTQRAAVTIMIATHQGDGTTRELRKCLQGLAKGLGQTKGTMNQITKNDESLGLNARAKLQQWIQRAAIPITRQRDSMGLKHLGFAQMQIGNQEFTAFRTPESLLREKFESLRPPSPGQAIASALRISAR